MLSKKEKQKEAYRRWREKNKEKDRERCRNYKAVNKDKIAEYNKKWTKENLKYKYHLNALRRAKKLNATPPWADLEAIKDFYQKCPEGYHVDHIVPLVHPSVCGLHTLENLQYLTAEENVKKSNKWNWGASI